jgi:hypothetical protein
VKDVENRTLEPGYIGKLLIHASQNIDRQAMEDLQLRLFDTELDLEAKLKEE